MQIELKGTNPMWFLLSKGVSLTMAQPKAEVDWQAMTPEEKKQIVLGIRWGLIQADRDTEALTQETIAVLPAPQQRKFPAHQASVRPPEEKTVAPAQSPTELLQLGVQKIRDFLDTNPPPQTIRELLELESNGKKRSSVLGLLHGKVNMLQQQVAASLQHSARTPPLPLPTSSRVAMVGSPQCSPIEESDQKQVTIRVGA